MTCHNLRNIFAEASSLKAESNFASQDAMQNLNDQSRSNPSLSQEKMLTITSFGDTARHPLCGFYA